MTDEKTVTLKRRQAMKRKGFSWGEQTGTLTPRRDGSYYSRQDSESSVDSDRSSLDLTPTLLGIYDKIASAGKYGEVGPADQSECDYFLTDEFLQDGSEDHCHSPKSSPSLEKKTYSFRLSESHDLHKPTSKDELDGSAERNYNRIKMDPAERKLIQEDIDTKKRPLSLSSMSSSSSSSLPRKPKRPNLDDYIDVRDGGLDIEKLDNILYIDDSPEGELSDVAESRTEDDEISFCSEDKHKSGGDSDSQLSADQSSNYGDQSEILNSTLSFHQSDSSLSYTPSTSANCSTADLSVQSDISTGTLKQNKPLRTPSRSSNSSMKQSGHYVSYVQRVVAEIIETERTYVENLEDIKVGYYQYILENPRLGMTVKERNYLFGNIVEIHDYSCDFLQELEECSMDPVKVAECFLRNNEGFVIYADYCTNYPSAVAVLTKVMHHPQLSEVFKQRQLAMGHSLPLGAYLLKPVQRVLKYHLLLQNILKHYNKSDPGYEKLSQALDHMTDMSHQINEMKRKHEHAVRVQEIQSQLEDYEGEDFTRLGELVLEGSFRMYGVKASRQVFLFQRGVIIAKRKEDGMLSCKAYIPCANLMLVESIPREPLNFQILPFNNPRGAHTIHSRNLDQKRKWCQEIKRLILESYSSKIPDSVKDLVMEKLGKSKEEDDLTQLGCADPGKSHVTTPDYLEKRFKLRRKSGPGLIQEILKPQRARKAQQQGRPRAESASPGTRSLQALESLMYNKEVQRNGNNEVEHTGYRTYIPGISKRDKQNQENQYQKAEKQKHPVSVQRSQSFQASTDKDKRKSLNYSADQGTVNDSMSMDNLSHSEGSAIRTQSFRIATRVSPIRLDSQDTVDGLTNRDAKLKDILTDKTNLGNISPAIKRSIDRELNKSRYSLSVKDVLLNSSHQDNLNGSYLDEANVRKRGRYASMPVLNSVTPSSPKSSRLASEGSATCVRNYDPNKSPHLSYKELDVKPYFNYDRSARLPSANDTVSTDLSRPGDSKHIHAFNDAFANLRRSQETLDRPSSVKPLILTQPKPFTSTLKNSANLLSSQAKLNRWGSKDRFTKGSLCDLSHLKEDPWIRDKQRSYTESNIKSPIKDQNYVQSGDNGKQDRHYGEKPVNKQMGRFSMNVESYKHEKSHSVSNDERTFSRDNMDWFVYASRNSLPISGFADDETNRSYKYCTPPRDAMVPPGSCSEVAKSPPHQNVTSYVTPPRYDGNRSNTRNYPHDVSVSNADSSVSLSATTSSSETCSSPDILKDVVFDDSYSPSSPYHRDRSTLSRSFSSPEGQRSTKFKKGRQFQEDRPASADILEDMSHIDASDRLVAEMESYMQRSSSSSGSGSISSSNNINRFPTSIPTFERKEETRNKNRDSVISTGSASSYESAGHDHDSDNEDGLVDTIKNKFHHITNKITGKKGTNDQYSSSQEAHSQANRYKQEDHPTKLLPSITHNFSLRIKSTNKTAEPDLPTILKEKEPGSQAIGARMANTDLDDYATFSLPRAHVAVNTSEVKTEYSETPKTRNTYKQYGRYSNSNLIPPNTSNFTQVKPQFKSQSALAMPLTPLKKSDEAQQADSAFSIQSVDIDSSSPEDTPRDDPDKGSDVIKDKTSCNGSEAADSYERRLSAVFNSDEAFRDSAVYDIEDIDSSPASNNGADELFQSTSGNGRYSGASSSFVPSKVPIKAYVQQLEEKNKMKAPPVVKVKTKEPSSSIKQRIESLAASAEYQSKSSSISRSMSTTTSRTHSRSSSRASSVEKHVPLTSATLKEYIDKKFPMEKENVDRLSYRSRSNSTGSLNNLKVALSTGKLNQVNSDTDNLVIMKGWVKELIGKFQDKN